MFNSDTLYFQKLYSFPLSKISAPDLFLELQSQTSIFSLDIPDLAETFQMKHMPSWPNFFTSYLLSPFVDPPLWTAPGTWLLKLETSES